MSTEKNGYKDILSSFNSERSFEEEVDFETQMLVLEFLSKIDKEMEDQNLKRKELAQMIGTSSSYITQIMRGNKIPNVRFLTALGLALKKRFKVTINNDYDNDYDENLIGDKFDSKQLLNAKSDLSILKLTYCSKKDSSIIEETCDKEQYYEQ